VAFNEHAVLWPYPKKLPRLSHNDRRQQGRGSGFPGFCDMSEFAAIY